MKKGVEVLLVVVVEEEGWCSRWLRLRLHQWCRRRSRRRVVVVAVVVGEEEVQGE